MIKIGKNYYIVAIVCVFYLVFLKSIDLISDIHFKLDKQEISELHKSAQNNNLTAIRKLTNFYYFIENDRNEAANIYRKYKDINPKVKMALYRFLNIHHSITRENNETIIVLEELANDGNTQALYALEHLYRFGETSAYTGKVFVEQDLQKSAYWTKISECNKKGINITECKTDKELRE
jgi:TPR repeat protein